MLAPILTHCPVTFHECLTHLLMSLGSPQATLSSPSLSTSHEGCLEGCSEEAIVKGEEGETEGAVSGSSPLLLLDHPAALELIHLLAPAIPRIPVRPEGWANSSHFAREKTSSSGETGSKPHGQSAGCRVCGPTLWSGSLLCPSLLDCLADTQDLW